MSDSEYSDTALRSNPERPSARSAFENLSDDESDGSPPTPVADRVGSVPRQQTASDGDEGDDADAVAIQNEDNEDEDEDHVVRHRNRRDGGNRNYDQDDEDEDEGSGRRNYRDDEEGADSDGSRGRSRRRTGHDGDDDSDQSGHLSRGRTVPRGPAHRRSLPMFPVADRPLTLLKMPPAIEVPLGPINPEKDDVPQDGGMPIMYRLKSGITRSEVERAIRAHGTTLAMPLIAESNARLVTWSDGSRTLMIGEGHYAVTPDRVAPSSLYIFKKFKDMQAYYGKVGNIFSVQPSTVNRKRSALALTSAIASASKQGRRMERIYDGGSEKEEKAALATYHSRQREEARLQSKRRRLAEKQVRPERRMTKADLESDEDDDDDFNEDQETIREERRREKEREARLRETQRAHVASERSVAPQRRKIGARRVLGSDDEDDEDDD